MTDIVPTLVDGAVVFSVQDTCTTKSNECESCSHLLVIFHNWIKNAHIEYLIFDLQEEKCFCETFMQELMLLKRRLQIPFLFVGVMDAPQAYLSKYNYGNEYPLFVTPEDAVRALRIQNPGLTEASLKTEVPFEKSFIHHAKAAKEPQDTSHSF